MPNEQVKSQLAAALDGAQEQIRALTRIQQERAVLTARAQARGKKVTVTVNADNVVVDVEFAGDIADLGYSEIARAVVEAARKASAEISRKSAELMTPFEAQRAGMPKLTDLLAQLSIDAPGLEIPEGVAAPLESPRVRRRRQFSDGSAAPGSAEDSRRGRRGSITETGW
ncbi:YbaB/EbfC family nucleoid-associated protein [Nocardia sp. CA-290969]|uniref:YbaB/EbfC family nucleoid-associated protein n=1 Tax=Nocardia sp. CA-290969 TaxID=3239986 RepID=UPI003D93D264